MTAPQQVWRIGKESKGGKKGESAILMMSFSPWEEEEQKYAASRGAGDGLSMNTLAAFFSQTETRLTASVYPILILNNHCLCYKLPWLTQMLTCNKSSNNHKKNKYSEVSSN